MPDLAWWLDAKRELVGITALERDAWHIYLAVAVQLISAAVMRRRLGDSTTLVPLVVLELLNEWADLTYEVWPDARTQQWTAAAHDVVNTLAMPLIILLIARRLHASR